MKDPHSILIRPLLTEKNMVAKERFNTMAFEVHPDANKIEIAKAVERVFNTQVESVRIINMMGKLKRMGRFEGRRSSWKKAYVKLRKGAKPIEYFEGV
ncbi:MAG: 50S ribosomal protein L23 [Acidobacteriota bacterium]|jgi:large subunit ribosomal protein L23